MWVRFSAPVQTGLGAYPAFYTMGTESFPGVKRPSSAEVKERVYLTPHLGLRGLFKGELYLLFTSDVAYSDADDV